MSDQEVPEYHPAASAAVERYRRASRAASDRSWHPLRMSVALNVFLWHLDGFARDDDPNPHFARTFDQAAGLLEAAVASGVCLDQFPPSAPSDPAEADLESQVSGLFSDVWVGLTDDVYFDQSYQFTKTRFEKNGLDPEEIFGGKVVLDAGCGSGKFSAALARFGAREVIGVDIGVKGLRFARAQAAKADYGSRLKYVDGSLLDLPLPDASVDMVWSNGVVHHTADYEKCIAEFARVVKPGGGLFLYVNGRFGLFELLLDALRLANQDIPRALFQHFLSLLGMNSGRIYWVMDCMYAPYEWKSRGEVEELLTKHGFTDLRRLTRGVDIDQIEQVSRGVPYAEVKYGQAQLKYLATRAQG